MILYQHKCKTPKTSSIGNCPFRSYTVFYDSRLATKVDPFRRSHLSTCVTSQTNCRDESLAFHPPPSVLLPWSRVQVSPHSPLTTAQIDSLPVLFAVSWPLFADPSAGLTSLSRSCDRFAHSKQIYGRCERDWPFFSETEA